LTNVHLTVVYVNLSEVSKQFLNKKRKRMNRTFLSGLCVGFVMLFVGNLAVAESTIPAPPTGNLRYSITVTKFKNEAGWSGRWNVGDGMKTKRRTS
jgi:hypothetical protein